jgi:ABC-type nitrate/sulfonate/bicarbonate transport system substrate-binding protein
LGEHYNVGLPPHDEIPGFRVSISCAGTLLHGHLVTFSLYTQNLPLFRIANGTSGENPAVFWVGVEQGFYRKHGLNVEVVYMRAGSLSVSALAAGDVQMVLTSSNAVLNVAAGGLDVVIIGSLFHRPEGDFMARSEIKRPEDLKGIPF